MDEETSSYSAGTDMAHRKSLGQFFTPEKVSDLMAEWVCREKPKRILDPAFGLGVFYTSVKKRLTEGFAFDAYEVDGHILEFVPHRVKTSINLRNKDYLQEEIRTYDGIIGNPPYLRFQQFANRHQVLPRLEESLQKKIAGHSNTSSVFLLKAIRELDDGGSMAFIMPFEFFNTGYGKIVKRDLLKDGLLKHIVIFANEKDIFPDATTTICVVLCRKDHQTSPISVSKIGSLGEIESVSSFGQTARHRLDPSDLPYDKKWSPIIDSLCGGVETPSGFRRFADYGSFIRGMATGANAFFALDKDRIDSLGLDSKHCSKCITKGSQVTGYVLSDRVFRRLSEEGRPVFCLNIPEPPGDAHARAYIRQGEAEGFHERHLTRHRSPWHRLERRTPAPILAGTFNRGRAKFVRNLTNSLHFACFHGFHPNLMGLGYVDRLFLYLVSSLGQRMAKSNKRDYGDGLEKFEPGDLNDCPAPGEDALDAIPEGEARRLVARLAAHGDRALGSVDALFSRVDA